MTEVQPSPTRLPHRLLFSRTRPEAYSFSRSITCRLDTLVPTCKLEISECRKLEDVVLELDI
jgi:hypothetical protein